MERGHAQLVRPALAAAAAARAVHAQRAGGEAVLARAQVAPRRHPGKEGGEEGKSGGSHFVIINPPG